MSPVELGRAGHFITHYLLVASLIPLSSYSGKSRWGPMTMQRFHSPVHLSCPFCPVPVCTCAEGGVASHANSSADLCWIET